MNDLAIVALTPNGLKLGRRLAKLLGHGEVIDIAESAKLKLQELFQAGRPLVCIMALGIVVRILGPCAKDKKTDPPVVVVDEAGRFAISVLGGHEGGANELANQVARSIGAVPVITTASEVLGFVLGVGCRRGVSCDEIDSLFQELCKTRGYMPSSLHEVATVSLKANEPGLREFAAKHGLCAASVSRNWLKSAICPRRALKFKRKLASPEWPSRPRCWRPAPPRFSFLNIAANA